MANAPAVPDCYFSWDIYDPFLPRRDLEATFYMGSPTVTQWKATLQPMVRGINYWEFSFSLEFDTRWDRRQEIVARRLLVHILLNGTEIAQNEVFNRRFNTDNRFTYDFQSIASISPQTEQHYLVVTIQISLPDRAGGNEVEDGLFHDDDLRCLSRNLSLLLHDPQYSNMMLIPRNSQEPTRVHSYLIDARWNNFFALHDFEAGIRSRVETNISRAVLKDILTYMYSGTFGITWPDWTQAHYTTELFKVIDRYKLYHLYKVFVKHDLLQFRVTRNSGIIESHLFPLQFANGRRIIDASYTWDVEYDPEYDLNFHIQINQNQAIPWLSYSLLSISPSKVYAKVNLEVVIQVNGNLLDISFHFYEEDFTIEPFAIVGSRNVLFLGCPDTFDLSHATEIRYFIRCFLNVTDGTTVEQIRSVLDDTLLNESARFGVLSDHMHQLRRQPVHGDMRVLSRIEGHDEHELYYQENAHKGVFAIRVPEWWEGLENVPPSNNLPETAISTLSGDSLPIVLDYMYTGKFFTLPIPFLNEIGQFAQKTLFLSLLDAVYRIRLHLRNL